MKILILIFIAMFLNAAEYGKIDMHGGKSSSMGKSNFSSNDFSSMFNKKAKDSKLMIKETKIKMNKKIKEIKEKINDK